MKRNISKFIYKDFTDLDVKFLDVKFGQKLNESDYDSDYDFSLNNRKESYKEIDKKVLEVDCVDSNNNSLVDHCDYQNQTNLGGHSSYLDNNNLESFVENSSSKSGFFSDDKDNRYDEKIEQIKKEAYDLGYEDCKMYMEKIISEYKINNQIVETLDSKIKEIHILEDRTEELFNFCIDALRLIASKLYMSVPTDFDKLLIEGLFKCVKKNFKGNKIEVVVHLSKVGYSNNVLQTQNLPERIKNYISITGEEGLGLDDCYIKYENTVLKYDRFSIEQEIDEILSRLCL